jgi:hypothetical protein
MLPALFTYLAFAPLCLYLLLPLFDLLRKGARSDLSRWSSGEDEVWLYLQERDSSFCTFFFSPCSGFWVVSSSIEISAVFPVVRQCD